MSKSNTKKQIKKPVILQVLPELNAGGVERGTVEIVKSLRSNDFLPLVASAGGSMVNQIISEGAKHITLPLASKNPFTIIKNIKNLVAIINEHKVDIVHARSRAPAWSAYFACKKTNCKFITTVHGPYSTKGGFLKKLYNSVMVKGEVIIAVSDFIKNYIETNYTTNETEIITIHRGVDIDHFNKKNVPEIRVIQQAKSLQIEHDKPVILLPGRMTQWKGHEFLINALSKINHNSFTCILVGDIKKHSQYVRRLHERIKNMRLSGSIRIIDNIHDMPALYSISDIVISASTRPEAFGRIAVEAQSMEKLVVATNHGGACETIIDGKTGWLVEPGNVEELVKVLTKLLNISDSKRKTVTAKARKHIQEQFSLEQMTTKTLAVYKKLLKSKKVRRKTNHDEK